MDRGDYFIHGLTGGAAVPSMGLSKYRGGKKKRGVDDTDLNGMMELVLNHMEEGHKLPEIKKQLKLEHPKATAKNIADAIKMAKAEKKGAGGGQSKPSRRGRRSAVVSPGPLPVMAEKVAESRAGDAVEVVDEKKAKCCLPKKGSGATPSMGVSRMRGGSVVQASTAVRRMANLGLADSRAMMEQKHRANPLDGGARKFSLTAPESLVNRARKREQLRKLIAKHGDKTPPRGPARSEPPELNRRRISNMAETMVLPRGAVPTAVIMDQLGMLPSELPPNATGQGKKRISKEEFLKRMAAGKAKKRGGALVGGTKREQWKVRAKKIFEDLWAKNKDKLQNDDDDEEDDDAQFDELWNKLQDEAIARAARELNYDPDADDKAWRPAGKMKYNAKKEPVYGSGHVIGGALGLGGDEFTAAKLRQPPMSIAESMGAQMAHHLMEHHGGRFVREFGAGMYGAGYHPPSGVPQPAPAPRPAPSQPQSQPSRQPSFFEKVKHEFTDPTSDLRSKYLMPVLGTTAALGATALGATAYNRSRGNVRAPVAAPGAAAALAAQRAGAETNWANQGSFFPSPDSYPREGKWTMPAAPARAAARRGSDAYESLIREADEAIRMAGRGRRKCGAGRYGAVAPPPPPPQKERTLGEKIKNEFVNPDSKLRRTVLPEFQQISEIAEVPLNVLGTVVSEGAYPTLGTNIRQGATAVNRSQQFAGDVQRRDIEGALGTLQSTVADVEAMYQPRRGRGKKPRGKTLVLEGGKRRRAKAGASDGRRKRATIVAEVMKKRGLSMIEASKVVKKEGLY